MSGRPFFSIVIPTLNEEKYLPLLLKDLARQTHSDFEVIHVDGNSDDATLKVSSPYKKQLSLHTKVVSKRNVSYQRNTGGKLAKGEWVIFMDADNRLPTYFLQGIRYQIDKHPEMDIFSCWVEVENDELLKKTMQKSINSFMELYLLIGKVAAFGALLGVRKALLKKHRFDHTQKVFEDARFAQEVVNAGHTFLLLKEPAFNCSLRRVEKEGLLRSAKILARNHLHFLQNKDFSKNHFGYVMQGGSYYDFVPPLPIKKWRQFIKNASENQLTKAKQLLKELQKQL